MAYSFDGAFFGTVHRSRIYLDRYTREQVSRIAASTLSRCLSTGSEIETQTEMDRKLHNACK